MSISGMEKFLFLLCSPKTSDTFYIGSVGRLYVYNSITEADGIISVFIHQLQCLQHLCRMRFDWFCIMVTYYVLNGQIIISYEFLRSGRGTDNRRLDFVFADYVKNLFYPFVHGSFRDKIVCFLPVTAMS